MHWQIYPKKAVSAILAINNADVKKVQLNDLIDKTIFEFLTVMKDCDLIEFDKFSDKEMEQFNRESARTIQKIVKQLLA